MAVPFAGSGVMADAERAWSLIVDHVNESGGVNGRELHVEQRDTPLSDAADLSPIADGFVDLADQGYKYIISLVSGAALAPIVEAAVPRGVLAMSITSEEPAGDLPPSGGMLLRGILATDRLIAEQASALQASGHMALAIVGETRGGTPDPRQVAMARAYASCASCAVVTVAYPAEADLYRYDWRQLGADVTSSRPDVVFLASPSAVALVDAVYSIESQGFSGEYHFAYGALMTVVADALGRPETAARFRSYDLALPPNDKLDRFLALYEAAHGEPVVPEPRLLAFADYLALLSLAVTEVGSEDPRQVAEAMKRIASPPGVPYGALDYAEAAGALRQGHEVDFVGLSGPLDFDERGEVPAGFIQAYGLDAAGQVVPLP